MTGSISGAGNLPVPAWLHSRGIPAANAEPDAGQVPPAQSASLAARQGVPAGFAQPAPLALDAATLEALQEAPQTRTVDGVAVIVSGHSVDNREGLSLIRTGSTLGLSSEIQAQLMREAVDGMVVSPGLSEVAGKAHEAPSSSLPVYRSVTRATMGGQTPRDLLNIAIDDHEARAIRDVEDFMKLVGVERALKAEHDPLAKLAYSQADGGYIMLTPDDLHYDDVASTENGVLDILSDIANGFLNADAVRDTLASYGYPV